MVRRLKTFLPHFLTLPTRKMDFFPFVPQKESVSSKLPRSNSVSVITLFSHKLYSSNPYFTPCQYSKAAKRDSAVAESLAASLGSPARRHSQDSSAKSLPNKWEMGLGTRLDLD